MSPVFKPSSAVLVSSSTVYSIESVEMSTPSGLPNDEITQLINALIDNHRIKDILMKSISSSAENLHTENNSDNNVDTRQGKQMRL